MNIFCILAQTLDLYTYAATDDGVCVGDGTFVGTVDEQCVADTDGECIAAL